MMLCDPRWCRADSGRSGHNQSEGLYALDADCHAVSACVVDERRVLVCRLDRPAHGAVDRAVRQGLDWLLTPVTDCPFEVADDRDADAVRGGSITYGCGHGELDETDDRSRGDLTERP